MAELLRDSVYRSIRDAILACEFWPGEELREQILAEKYHVSRSPIRDSLLRLEQEKLVTVLPRQGYRVNTISVHDVQELFGLRLVVAPACAAEAAQADDAAIQILDPFYDVIDDFAQPAFIDHNREFHGAVARLSGNTRLAAVEISLVGEFDRLVQVCLQANSAQRIPVAVDEHRTIIDAIRQHDSDAAARLVRDHILTAQQRFIAAWPLRQEQEAPLPDERSMDETVASVD